MIDSTVNTVEKLVLAFTNEEPKLRLLAVEKVFIAIFSTLSPKAN